MSIHYDESEIEAARQEAIEGLRSDVDENAAAFRFEPEQYQPSSFGYHEALHTASLVMDLLDRAPLEHPAIILDPTAYRLAHEAHTNLFNLYQHLGATHLSSTERQVHEELP